jgi:hypothetical protein
MTATTLRLCHSGMDNRALYAFEIFLSRVGPGACRIAEEDAADVAFIDVDNDLGPYLLAGHRMLYPHRPLIVTTQAPGQRPDPLTVEITKPVGLAAFSAALEKVRSLLPPADTATTLGLPDAGDERGGTVDSIPDEIALDTLSGAGPDEVALLRRFEARMATLHVGSLPDADLDNPAALAGIYYDPASFLQGLVARAITHAREIGARYASTTPAARPSSSTRAMVRHGPPAAPMPCVPSPSSPPAAPSPWLARRPTHRCRRAPWPAPWMAWSGSWPCGPRGDVCPGEPGWSTPSASRAGPTSPVWPSRRKPCASPACGRGAS